MIYFKSAREIQIMREAGKKLKRVVDVLLPEIKPGVDASYINKLAEKEILKQGGKPSFKTVAGYEWAICLPVNEQIVHTPPYKRVLKPGDLVTLDIGLMYKGYHVDYATTFYLGRNIPEKIKGFLEVGKRTLDKAIRKIKPGVFLGEISYTIQANIEGAGYSIVKELSGHGIGRSLHEDPFVLNFLDRPIEQTMKLKEGLTLAIEVIYSMGKGKMDYEEDGWSIITQDKSLSACFEHTIVVVKEGVEILV